MSFTTELYKGMSEFLSMIREGNATDVLLMPYAEYSLQCFILYQEALERGLLHKSSPLAQAFRNLGINEARDQLVIFLDTFYLYWHTQKDSFS
ncbi:MAG: hypothetical protein IKU38_04430 [Clostridia bacterium]|nr:hypothetical protein [Clostridia bacterium]